MYMLRVKHMKMVNRGILKINFHSVVVFIQK